MISSTSNQKVKQAAALAKKAKYRTETGLFVVEGPKMAAELPDDRIQQVYVTEHFLEEEKKKADHALYQKLKQLKCVETVERLQDPGNLGTILRAGDEAGITGVIMDSQTADIYNPKVIRSTMGAVFRVPFVYVEDLKAALLQLKDHGVHLYAAHLKGQNPYDQEDYTESTGFLIGNEAQGLSDEIASLADTYVKIPMAGSVESLNAAIASSVLMFEVARQRRNQK